MTSIVENYASALFAVYLEEPKVSFFKDLKSLQVIFRKEEELIKLLNSPMLLKTEKNAIIDTIFRNKINKMLVNFLHILVENNSFLRILKIIKIALIKINEEQGICFAAIESVFQLDENQIIRIKQAIEKRKQCKVEYEFLINKSLIGGVKITIGNEVIDSSIKYKLEKIKQGMEAL